MKTCKFNFIIILLFLVIISCNTNKQYNNISINIDTLKFKVDTISLLKELNNIQPLNFDSIVNN